MTQSSQDLRSPSAEYVGPPKEWFVEAAWHERDLEAVFRSRWLVVGHVDELSSEDGFGYFTFKLGDDEVLIRRGPDGEVRGYYNVCAHRGSRLVESGAGTTRARHIVCPYHSWSYKVDDGSLQSAQNMHPDFDKSNIRLAPVQLEVWNGLIFVCLSDTPAAPVDQYLGGLTFGGHDWNGLKLVRHQHHEVNANWKIVVENNLECYHCVQLHPELSAVWNWRINEEADFDGALATRAHGAEVFEGVYPVQLTIDGERVCSIPTPHTSQGERQTYLSQWEPGTTMAMGRDYAWMFVPVPVGPQRTELHQFFFVAADATEGSDYTVDQVTRFMNVTMAQDQWVCEEVQRGLRMRPYQPGPFNRLHQAGNAAFYAWYIEEIRKSFPDLVTIAKPEGDGTQGLAGYAVAG